MLQARVVARTPIGERRTWETGLVSRRRFGHTGAPIFARPPREDPLAPGFADRNVTVPSSPPNLESYLKGCGR
jgi:hypothetical protein